MTSQVEPRIFETTNVHPVSGIDTSEWIFLFDFLRRLIVGVG